MNRLAGGYAPAGRSSDANSPVRMTVGARADARGSIIVRASVMPRER